MNEIMIFNNPEFGQVRTVEVNGEPYFVGKDICMAFGDKNHNRSLGRVSDDDKVVVEITDSMGRNQSIMCQSVGCRFAIGNDESAGA